MTFRKKSSLRYLRTKDNPSTLVFLNNKPFTSEQVYFSKEFKDVFESLEPKIYFLSIKGGGLISQKELVYKILFKYVSASKRVKLKKTHDTIDRTDVRRNYPKKYGGRKARARFQKSYR